MAASQDWTITNTTAASVTCNLAVAYGSGSGWVILKNGGGTVITSIVVGAVSSAVVKVSTDPTTLIGGNTYTATLTATATLAVGGSPLTVSIAEIVTLPPILNDGFQRANTVSDPGTIASPDSATNGNTYIVDATHCYGHVSGNKLVMDSGSYPNAIYYPAGTANATVIGTIGTVDSNGAHGLSLSLRQVDYQTMITVTYLGAQVYAIWWDGGIQTIVGASVGYPLDASSTYNHPSVGDIIEASIDSSHNLNVWVTPTGLTRTQLMTNRSFSAYTHNTAQGFGFGADPAGWALSHLKITSP